MEDKSLAGVAYDSGSSLSREQCVHKEKWKLLAAKTAQTSKWIRPRKLPRFR